MPSLEENLARYEKLIPHLHHTQVALWRSVDVEMMRAGCGVMASATGCSFMPRDDDSVALMLNYCCFNVFFPGHRTLVEVYAAEHPPENDDQRAVFEAHLRSAFSLFEVMQLIPRIGLRLRELFTDEILVVIYPRLAETLRQGFVLPVRVMPLEDFHVVFNGPIPFRETASVHEFEQSLFNAYGKHGVQKGRPLTAEQRENIETFQTIDVLSLRYPELVQPHRRKPSTPPPASRLGHGPLSPRLNAGCNDRCPCGSGKKFKHCCLGRN